MVQNTRGLDVVSDGLEARFSPLPMLAGKCIDDLFDEYSKLVETIRSFNWITHMTHPTSCQTHKTRKFML